MKVLFVMFAFPDMNTSFNMYTTIVEQFHKNGHEVFVVAPARDQVATNIVMENNIDVLRVRSLPIKNVHNYLKGISNLLLPFQFKAAIKKHFNNVRFDLIISATPPVTLGGLIASLKQEHQAKFYLILRDIFPQNAVDLGFIKKNSLFHRYFRSREKKLYKIADQIGCMSQGNIDYVLENDPYVADEKLHILENFQKKFKNFLVDKVKLKLKYGLDDKFVIIFGGNMGKPQQLENVLQLAKNSEKYNDVIFLLLGEGTQMNHLRNKIEQEKIKNIKIESTIPKDEYQKLLSVCDIGLISLHESFTIPNIPSKSLDYFNVGIPVLASLDKATDFGKMLDDAKAGLWCLAGSHDKWISQLEKLYNDKNLKEQLGKNGRKYFEKNLLPENAYSIIESVMK